MAEVRNERPLTEAELEDEILRLNNDTKRGTDLFAGDEERAREELNNLAPERSTGDKSKI